MKDLQAFLAGSAIPFAIRDSDRFSSLQASYSGSYEEAAPRAIVLPQDAEQARQVVEYCVAYKLPVVVRGGGHDMYGRFTALDAVCVDLRGLTSVNVSEDSKTVRIGGGITHLQLAEELAGHGLQVPIGACANVGYTGWCLAGGFGPYIHSYGLGADQIVGARVVDSHGQLVDADARMLKGLRGGGGNLGLVAELEVKAYPLQEVQAGMLPFDSADVGKTFKTLLTSYSSMLADTENPLPRQLHLIPFVCILPGIGKTVMCCFIWNGSASDESRAWLDRVARMAPLMPGTPEPSVAVQTTSIHGFAATVQSVLAPRVRGRMASSSFSRMSPAVIDVVARAAETLPSDSVAGVINFHTMRSDSPSCSADVPDSVCPHREPHVMLELIGIGIDEATAVDAIAWANAAHEDMLGVKEVMRRTYAALTPPEWTNLDDIYGEKLVELMELKKEYDPEWVFEHAVPKLPNPRLS